MVSCWSFLLHDLRVKQKKIKRLNYKEIGTEKIKESNFSLKVFHYTNNKEKLRGKSVIINIHKRIILT